MLHCQVFNLQICMAYSLLSCQQEKSPRLPRFSHFQCCLQETELRRLQERCRQLDKEAVITRCSPCYWCLAAMWRSAAGLQQQNCEGGRPRAAAATPQCAAYCTFAPLKPTPWTGCPSGRLRWGMFVGWHQLDCGQQVSGSGLRQPCHLPAAKNLRPADHSPAAALTGPVRSSPERRHPTSH